MPIYAYRCASCGFEKDVLQKISDTPLTQCPSCGTDAFRKQVTAAGFQLKGSGWYVTDFRGGNGGASAPASGAKSGESGEPGEAKPAGESKPAGDSAAPAAPSTASPAAAASSSTSGSASTSGTASAN